MVEFCTRITCFCLIWGDRALVTLNPHLVIVQSLSHDWFFAPPWTVVHQASLSITNSWSLLELMFIDSVMLSTISSSVISFSSCLQSFLASESFQMRCHFTSWGLQSMGPQRVGQDSVTESSLMILIFSCSWSDYRARVHPTWFPRSRVMLSVTKKQWARM